jgi:uncharacterized protein
LARHWAGSAAKRYAQAAVLPTSGGRHKIERMSEDLQARLRRLGLKKGARDLKTLAERRLRESGRQPADEPPEMPLDDAEAPLDQLVPGIRLVDGPLGGCYVLDTVYSLEHRHGLWHLGDFRRMPLWAAAEVSQQAALAEIDSEGFLFIDTETTGLAGAGTFAFMVGAAFFQGGAFVVRQYFLRDQGDEAAMLAELASLIHERPGLITFNGRAFDLPLLDGRYVLNRLDGLVGDLLERPHLDLLHPSRRLWRARLGSCALGSLETNLLDLQRTHEDVPGWMIPGLYFDYLRSGDARPLLGVFYHNRMDMLSMVCLATEIMRQFARPEALDHALDLRSLARWQLSMNKAAEAEANLRLAAAADSSLDVYQQVMADLSALLKRQGRRDEAVDLWQQLAVTSLDDVSAHIELAKHYEWQAGDLAAARRWTEQALNLVQDWSPYRAPPVREELLHRLARLDRKLAEDH